MTMTILIVGGSTVYEQYLGGYSLQRGIVKKVKWTTLKKVKSNIQEGSQEPLTSPRRVKTFIL